MTDIELREITKDDLEMIRLWRNSKEVSQYMYTENQISTEEQQKWFDRISHDKTSMYWIIQYDTKPLGVVSISEINKVFDSCFWAFYLGDSSVRGVGIGAKVEYHIISYVFDTLQLNKLCCEVLTTNEKVIKMHEKFGFRKEAYYRDHVLKNGQYYDVIGLAILKRDWQQIKEYHYNRIYLK